MSLFYHPEEEVVLSSPMEGRITHNNAPVVGAKVERFIKWKDEKGQRDVAVTDADGYFRLPLVKEQARLAKLSRFVVLQEIRAFHNQKEYLFWTMAKMDEVGKQLYGELGGSPVNFRCELTDSSRSLNLDHAALVTVCQWDSIKAEGE